MLLTASHGATAPARRISAFVVIGQGNYPDREFRIHANQGNSEIPGYVLLDLRAHQRLTLGRNANAGIENLPALDSLDPGCVFNPMIGSEVPIRPRLAGHGVNGYAIHGYAWQPTTSLARSEMTQIRCGMRECWYLIDITHGEFG